jgi:hypothetical protein
MRQTNAERRKRALRQVQDAHTAMELFDAAVSLMERVRGNYRTQQAANRMARLLVRERSRQLKRLDSGAAVLVE